MILRVLESYWLGEVAKSGSSSNIEGVKGDLRTGLLDEAGATELMRRVRRRGGFRRGPERARHRR